MPADNPSGKWALALLTLFGTIGLGYFTSQNEFARILAFYLPFFLAYVLIAARSHSSDLNFFLGLALLSRFILLFAMPQLSDDVYRFIWDGRLLVAGINPFDALPSAWMEQELRPPGIDQELFALLNSPEHFTIYPPVCQATFALAAWAFPESYLGSAFVMKAFLLLCETGSIFLMIRLLAKFGLPRERVLWYALNPLIIIEICGNLHYEGAMVFFLLLGLFLLFEEKTAGAAVAFSLSIASKLLPLMFLPLLFRKLGWRKSLRFFIVLGLCLLALFAPLFNSLFFAHFADSIDLYFRKFEFNGSIYYLFRWIGYQIKGYNLIGLYGPVMALLVFTGIIWMAFRDRSKDVSGLPQVWLAAICLYLFLTPTLHPWYLGLPLALCVFTRFRFPVLWSGLIMLTYVNYSYELYRENLWVVVIEYFCVFAFLLIEYFGKPKYSISKKAF